MAVAGAACGVVMGKCCGCAKCLCRETACAVPGVFEPGFKVVVATCKSCRTAFRSTGELKITWGGARKILKLREEKKP